VLTLRHDVGLVVPFLLIPMPGTNGGSVSLGIAHQHPLLRLRAVSYVPGLALTGALRLRTPFAPGTVTVSLGGRRYGQLTLTPDGSITGVLGGTPFHIGIAEREQINADGGLTALPTF
jgi:hypothetical protein